ncbi:acyl-CoA dehydrogenases [Pelotomaculum thermopropionicum SI]|uniref:Acyl-CoA dehydrogenases n=1 Tax=Pelotomaculum thermopropionicum (strain DSM 13744 / JCM 10971 / SI) TaxID=370438 RepID=A5CZI0_PELTS|nr:acyl-CoA dehydrogenases [Pelotomaculum thermopropionicum SI]
MDFQFTEEQLLIKNSIREFAEENAENEDSYAVVKRLADIDFLGIFFPEIYGGAGSDFTSFIIAVEELAKVSASAAVVYANHCCLAENAIYQWGSDELKEEYLSKLCRGEKIGGFAFSEGSLNTDWLLINTTAERQGGYYILNGKKTYVVNAQPQSLFIVVAKTGEKEYSSFVVEGDAGGVTVGPAHAKMGLEGVCVTDITLENVKVPAANLIGTPGQGLAIAAGVLGLQNVALAAIAVGISQTALEKSISYAKERVQFGRPIIKFEALQVMVGKMAAYTEAARLLTYKAASLRDQGEDFVQAGEMARYIAQTAGEQTCIDAVQIHGGYGYSKDLGIDALYRDMKGISLFDTSEKPIILQIARKSIT